MHARDPQPDRLPRWLTVMVGLLFLWFGCGSELTLALHSGTSHAAHGHCDHEDDGDHTPGHAECKICKTLLIGSTFKGTGLGAPILVVRADVGRMFIWSEGPGGSLPVRVLRSRGPPARETI